MHFCRQWLAFFHSIVVFPECVAKFAHAACVSATIANRVRCARAMAVLIWGVLQKRSLLKSCGKRDAL